MNILILNWRDPQNPASGGAEIVTMQHAKRWVQEGNSVIWFTSRFRHSLEKETIDGITIVRRGNFLTIFFLAPFFYLFSGIKFDIVVDEIHGIPFFTPLYVRKPKIAFIHEVAGEIWDSMYPFPINIVGKLLEKVYFKLYRNIWFWTDAPSTIEDLQRMGINPSRCIAIPCPANTIPLRSIPQKENLPTFLFVGRIVKMKGIEDIIYAFALISRQIKAKLWIIGEGEPRYIAALQKKTQELEIRNQVIFFGRVSEEEKIEHMKRGHILLHASIREGWGIVVIEAASQATPSIAYNIQGLKDSIHNGKTGILVKENNPSLLADTAVSLIKDKAKYRILQNNCLEWAKQLKWDKVTSESFLLLKETVLQKKSALL